MNTIEKRIKSKKNLLIYLAAVIFLIVRYQVGYSFSIDLFDDLVLGLVIFVPIQDSSLLQNYLDDLSQHLPANNWTENEEMAYWINAYNAFTVKLFIGYYPLRSIKVIKSKIH